MFILEGRGRTWTQFNGFLARCLGFRIGVDVFFSFFECFSGDGWRNVIVKE